MTMMNKLLPGGGLISHWETAQPGDYNLFTAHCFFIITNVPVPDNVGKVRAGSYCKTQSLTVTRHDWSPPGQPLFRLDEDEKFLMMIYFKDWWWRFETRCWCVDGDDGADGADGADDECDLRPGAGVLTHSEGGGRVDQLSRQVCISEKL